MPKNIIRRTAFMLLAALLVVSGGVSTFDRNAEAFTPISSSISVSTRQAVVGEPVTVTAHVVDANALGIEGIVVDFLFEPVEPTAGEPIIDQCVTQPGGRCEVLLLNQEYDAVVVSGTVDYNQNEIELMPLPIRLQGSGTVVTYTKPEPPVPPAEEYWQGPMWVHTWQGEPVYADGREKWDIAINLYSDIPGWKGPDLADVITITTSDPELQLTPLRYAGEGSYYMEATSKKAGTFTVTSTVGGITQEAFVTFKELSPGCPDVVLERLWIVPQGPDKYVDVESSWQGTVTLTGGSQEPWGKGDFLRVKASDPVVQISELIDKGDGNYTFNVTSSRIGRYDITAFMDSECVTRRLDAQITFVPQDTSKEFWMGKFVVEPFTGGRLPYNVGPIYADGREGWEGVVQLDTWNIVGWDGSGRTDAVSVVSADPAVTITPVRSHNNSIYSVRMTSTTPGTYSVKAIVDGVSIERQITFVPVPVVAMADMVVVPEIPNPANTVPADGSSTWLAKISLVDLANNGAPLAGFATSIDLVPAHPATKISEIHDMGDGSYLARITSDHAGVFRLKAVVADRSKEGFVSFSATKLGCDPAYKISDFTLVPDNGESVLADGISTWVGTLTLADQYYPDALGAGYDFTMGYSTSHPEVKGSPFYDHGDGTYTIKFSSTIPGDVTVGLHLNNMCGAWTGDRTITFDEVIPEVPEIVSFTSAPAVPTPPVAPNGDASWMGTIQLADVNGQPAVGYASAITLNAPHPAVSVSEVWDNGDGTYSMKIKAVKAGAFYVTATTGGLVFQSNVFFEDYSPQCESAYKVIDFQATTSTGVAPIHSDGVQAHQFSFTIVDSYAPQVNGSDMAHAIWQYSDPGLDLESFIDHGNGTYTISYTSTTPGEYDAHIRVFDGCGTWGAASRMVFEPVPVDPPTPDITVSLVDVTWTPVVEKITECRYLEWVDKWVGTFTLVEEGNGGNGSGYADFFTVSVNKYGIEVSDVADLGDGTYSVTLTSQSMWLDATATVAFGETKVPQSVYFYNIHGDWWPSMSGFTVEPSKDHVTANGSEAWIGTISMDVWCEDPMAFIPMIGVRASNPGIEISELSYIGKDERGNALYNVFFTSEIEGEFTVAASYMGWYWQSQDITFEPYLIGDPSATLSDFTVEPRGSWTPNISHGDSWVGTVVLEGGLDWPWGKADDIVVSVSDPGLVTVSELVDNMDGSYSMNINADKPGKYTIAVAYGGLKLTQEVRFDDDVIICDPLFAIGKFTVAPSEGTSVAADGDSSWMGTVRLISYFDEFFNGSGFADGLTVTASDPAVTISPLFDHGDGTYSYKMSSKKAGEFSVSVATNQCGGEDVKSQVVTFLPITEIPGPGTPSPAQSFVSVSSTMINDGDTVEVTSVVKDSAGNLLDGVEVKIVGEYYPEWEFTSQTCISNEQGLCSVKFATGKYRADKLVILAYIDGQEISMSGTSVYISTIVICESPDIEVAHPTRSVGETQVVTGANFTPGEDVALVLHSDPYEVGTLQANDEGMVSFSFDIPTGFPAGIHTAILTGALSGQISQSTFEVLGSDAPLLTASTLGGHEVPAPPTSSEPVTDSVTAGTLAVAPTGGSVAPAPWTFWVSVTFMIGALVLLRLRGALYV
ncbi:MAG: hypothetical protein FWG15_04220 [Propionibacteriaceae bacterium]|nr:hypothetical protein [Propionibacteriaceae bacterium]